MERRNLGEYLSKRELIRRWKLCNIYFHFLSVFVLFGYALYTLPLLKDLQKKQLGQSVRNTSHLRQQLLETLDKFARYQKYHHQLYGRYTRDLSRLHLPEKLASGNLEEVERNFEISVLELQPNRFLLLATGVGSADRVMIDERFRLSANFSVPPPSRQYLLEEADRLLRMRDNGRAPVLGLYSDYWRFDKTEGSWYAVGQRNPVQGERRDVDRARSIASIFATVSEHVKSRMQESGNSLAKDELSVQDVNEWLRTARLAQYVYRQEYGSFARRWEQLDLVSSYRFAERIKHARNIRVHPIEVDADETGFTFTLEGTAGDLLGEQFVLDQGGTVRQVRYTEALIQQLQQTTDLLENATRFQINALPDDKLGEP